MSFNDKQFEDYLSRLQHVQQRQQQQPLTVEERRELALSLGFSQEDFEAAEREFDAYTTKSQGFLALGNWSEALKALEVALAIQPHETNLLYNKALCHVFLWRNGRQAIHLEQAECTLRLCVDLNPRHERAMELLTQLQKEQIQKPMVENQAFKVWFIQGLVFFIIIFFISIIWNGINYNPPSYMEMEEMGQPIVSSSEEVVPKDPSLGQGVFLVADGLPLPVVLDEEAKKYALWFRVERSELLDVGGTAVVGGIGFYVKPIGFNAAKLSFAVEFLDAQDRLLFKSVLPAEVFSLDYALDGDAMYPISLSILEQISLDAVAKARIKVVDVKVSDLPKSQLQPTAWSWATTPRPVPNESPELYTQGSKGLSLRTLYSRFEDEPSFRGSKKSQKLVLEILNLHEQSALSSLNATIEWRDDQGKKLSSANVELLRQGKEMPLKPKEAVRCTYFFDFGIPPTVHNFHININSLQLAK